MAFTHQNRPGVDTDIVQTQVLRGCDALFPGNLGGTTLLVRGGDTQGLGVPGDIVVQPGQNIGTSDVGSITFLRRSSDRNDEILILRASDDINAGPHFGVYGGNGDPNGTVFAPESSIYFDDATPGLWIKTTDESVDTGWEQLATIPVVTQDLEQTLLVGNTTGALPIIISEPMSGIHGADGVGVGENGVPYTVRAGDSGGGHGGALLVRGGDATAGTGNGGNARLRGGNSLDGAGGSAVIEGGISGASWTGGLVRLTAGLGGPGVGGSGGPVEITAGNGLGGAGGSVTTTAGNGGTGQNGGAITMTAGQGVLGGAITMTAGQGAGAAGGAGGAVHIQGGSGDPINGGNGGDINLSAGHAQTGPGPTSGGVIALTPGLGAGGGPNGEVVVNGKLTVTGLIDPTGLIFTEQSGNNTDMPVPANEGGIYVSDGSDGRQGNALYYKDASGNHFQVAPLPATVGTGPVEAWLRSAWGYIGPNSEASGFVAAEGLLEGVNIVINGDGSVTRASDDAGVIIQIQSGTNPNTSYAFVESDQLPLRIVDRFMVYARFSLNTTSSNIRAFVGLRDLISSSVAFATTDSSNLNTQSYIGFSTTEVPGSMALVSAKNGTKAVEVIGTMGAISFDPRWMVIDATVPGQITVRSLIESGGELVEEASLLVDNPDEFPVDATSLEVLASSGIRSGSSGMSVRLGHVSVVTRADLVNQAAGAGVSPLSAVLSIGNAMGSNSIVVDASTPTPNFKGADNLVGEGTTISFAAGNALGGASSGGSIEFFTGEHDPGAAIARSGTFVVNTADATGSNETGGVFLFTGDADSGPSGPITLATGDTNTGTAGGVTIETGDGQPAGGIQLKTGNTFGAGVDGLDISLTCGESIDGRGGQVQITAGNSNGAVSGGSIVLTPGLGLGAGSDGIVFAQGSLTVTGETTSRGLLLEHTAVAPKAPDLGYSTVWVRSTDNTLFMTDIGGNNHMLSVKNGVTPAVDVSTTTVINFPSAFDPGQVTVNTTIEGSSAPPMHWIHSVSESGFTVEFGAAPGAGFSIHWTARQ